MLNKSILLICIGLLTVTTLGFIHVNKHEPLPIFDPFPSYPLTDIDGQAYDFNNHKIKLITFFYTKCPDVCPITIHDLTTLYEELNKRPLLAKDVDILTITLDPDYDTEEVIKAYKNSYQITDDQDHWYFLRASVKDITNLTNDLGFYREETGGFWSHSTTIYLVDYQNRKRSFHLMSNPNQPLDINTIIRDINYLKKENEKGGE